MRHVLFYQLPSKDPEKTRSKVRSPRRVGAEYEDTKGVTDPQGAPQSWGSEVANSPGGKWKRGHPNGNYKEEKPSLVNIHSLILSMNTPTLPNVPGTVLGMEQCAC